MLQAMMTRIDGVGYMISPPWRGATPRKGLGMEREKNWKNCWKRKTTHGSMSES